MREPLFLIVDLFCGAGGTTTGFEMAGGVAKVIACVNHDPKAIKSHWLNHPDVKHFEEDIRTLELAPLVEIVNYWKARYPNAVLILWASLECTNFSKAKGGQPRDADSRTLADHLDRYIVALDPDYVQIENVVEFMSWGPLDENGKPESRKNGQDWLRWRRLICAHGYRDEWRELNSANFGAYTSRNRLFGVFAKEGLPIAWPEPTHFKMSQKERNEYLAKKIASAPSLISIQKNLFDAYGGKLPWKAVKEVLDFSDEGESIFTRSKPLSDKTLERIYAGLLKFVAKGDTSFISKYYSGKPAGKVNSVNAPASTVTTFGNQTLVQVVSDKNISIDGPAGTVTCVDHHSLVQADFLLKYNSTNGKTGKHTPPSIDEPAPVVSCQGRLGLVKPEFLSSQNSSVEDPMGTLTTKDRAALVQPEYFIDKHFGKAQNQSINEPADTIMPTDKHRLVEVEPFIMPTNYDNTPKSIDEPAPTITANRKHHYIVNPSHGGHCTSTDAPCPVIVARQDKAPLYVVQVEAGKVAVAVYEGDSEAMIRIKQFMAAYELVDIKMRMLRVSELLKIQGFPEGYRLEGNQADQKKFIGNSVVPHVVKAWTEALANRFSEPNQRVA